MRIAHLTSNLSRRGGGVAAVVEAVSAAQWAAGHEVGVFGLSDADWSEVDRFEWQGGHPVAAEVRGPSAFGYAPSLWSALSDFRPRALHLHGVWMYPSLVALKWRQQTGRPLIISPHGMLSDTALGYGRAKKAVVARLFQNATFNAASALHATWEGEVAECRAYGVTAPACVIPNGIAVRDRPVTAPAAAPFRILSLGRIHPKKGLDRLIAAWARIAGDHPEWCVDIVGPDERGHAGELRRQADTLGAPRVTIRGPVVGADKDRLMAEAEVFVLPTRSDNFALTVAESLMMETPVISTTGAPWNGLKEYGAGWWIDQGVEALTIALQQALALSPDVRRHMGQRGRAWMKLDFAWSGIASRLVDVYRDAETELAEADRRGKLAS